jgi:ketopantoate hydroxymethyltransferase
MTMLGYDSTLPVTMVDMIRHSQAVRRGSPNAWLIGDMPYMSYQASTESAIRNAGRFMAEASCDAIKLEGGANVIERVRGIVSAGIPVMGHLGLTPQSVSALGGFRVQGKGALQADMFGLYPKFKPRMAKVFGEAGSVILNGLKDYVREVEARQFPQEENWFSMPDDEYDELVKMLD